MLTKITRGIDKFYVVLGLVLAVLTVPMIFAIKTIFSAFLTANEIDNSAGSVTRIVRSELDESISKVYDKEAPELIIRETSITIGSVPTESE